MIYIQSTKDRSLPHHFDAACAMYGAIETAQDYRLTSFEEVASGKFDALIKRNLFVGSVEFMREVFKRADKHDVRLPLNSDRPCEIMTLAEAHRHVAAGKRLFIKPIEIKLFTGLVLDGCVYSCLKELPEDTMVMAYEPFKNKILSEWRLYIHGSKIVDARNYSGDFKIQPDYDLAQSKINALEINAKTYLPTPFPCAYTMDVACFKDGADEVCELNDAWAVGSYGVENNLYLRMLSDRYFEIMQH